MYWPSLDSDVVRHVRSCFPCIHNLKGPFFEQSFNVKTWASGPYQVIYLDHAGPYPETRGRSEYPWIFYTIQNLKE